MIQEQPSIISQIPLNQKALALYFKELKEQQSSTLSRDSSAGIKEDIENLLTSSVKFINDDQEKNNAIGLQLLENFHQYFASISQILNPDDSLEFAKLFNLQSHHAESPASVRFVSSIASFMGDADQQELIKKTLVDALKYYVAVVEKFHHQLHKATLDEELSSDKHTEIIKETLINSLLTFFGTDNDNPFACLAGTRMRLIDAKLALDVQPLYIAIIKEIIYKQVAKTAKSIKNQGNQIHIINSYHYLLYDNDIFMKNIDQFFKINIKNIDLREALEFIKKFPETLESVTRKNIEDYYDIITSSGNFATKNSEITIDTPRAASSIQISIKFLDSLNQALELDKEEEKLKLHDFFTLDEDDFIKYYPTDKEKVMTLIYEKYHLLIERKYRQSYSIINIESINYSTDFPHDIFYQDSSIPDASKIDNLVDLFLYPKSPLEIRKNLWFLFQIFKGYKIGFVNDIALENSQQFLILYLNEFLDKFAKKYQSVHNHKYNFKAYLAEIYRFNRGLFAEIVDQHMRLSRNFEQETTNLTSALFEGHNIIKENQDLIINFIYAIFKLGIIKTQPDSEKLASFREILGHHLPPLIKNQSVIRMSYSGSSTPKKTTPPSKQIANNQKKIILNYLIQHHQEGLIETFLNFKLNDEKVCKSLEIKESEYLLDQAKKTKNLNALSIILQFSQAKFIGSDYVYQLIKSSIEKSLEKEFEIILNYHDIDQLKKFLDSKKFELIESICTKFPNAKILKILLLKLQDLNIDLPDIYQTKLYQPILFQSNILSYGLLMSHMSSNQQRKSSYCELFKTLLAFYSEKKSNEPLFNKISVKFFSKNSKQSTASFFNILEIASLCKDTELFKLIIETYIKIKPDFMKESMKKTIKIQDDDLNLLAFALDYSPEIFKTLITNYYNHEQYLELLADTKIKKIDQGINKSLDILEYSYQYNSELYNFCIRRISDLEILKVFTKYLEDKKNTIFVYLRKSPERSFYSLERAIRQGNNNFLQKFLDGYDDELEKKQLLFARKSKKSNLLTLACELNKSEAVKILLQNCPKEHLKDFILSSNALFLAAIHGDKELLAVFFDNLPEGCDKKFIFNQRTFNNNCIINLSLQQDKFDNVEFLFEKLHEKPGQTPIDKNILFLKITESKNDFQRTIIQYSLEFKKEDKEQKIIDFLSRIAINIPSEKTGQFINNKDRYGCAILDTALSKNFTNLAKQAILCGAIITQPSQKLLETNDDKYSLTQFNHKIYQVLKSISDGEILPEKIHNPTTFSNLLFYKAIIDSDQFEEDKKLTIIAKLIEINQENSSLIDQFVKDDSSMEIESSTPRQDLLSSLLLDEDDKKILVRLANLLKENSKKRPCANLFSAADSLTQNSKRSRLESAKDPEPDIPHAILGHPSPSTSPRTQAAATEKNQRIML